MKQTIKSILGHLKTEEKIIVKRSIEISLLKNNIAVEVYNEIVLSTQITDKIAKEKLFQKIIAGVKTVDNKYYLRYFDVNEKERQQYKKLLINKVKKQLEEK